MSVTAVGVVGLAIALLGFVAMVVAPKGKDPDTADPGGDGTAAPWAFVTFGFGLTLGLSGSLSGNWRNLVLTWAVLIGLALWGLAVRWFGRMTAEQDRRAREKAVQEGGGHG